MCEREWNITHVTEKTFPVLTRAVNNYDYYYDDDNNNILGQAPSNMAYTQDQPSTVTWNTLFIMTCQPSI